MKKRILIADDEAALLRTMAFTLRRKGYETKTFTDGRSAYEEIQKSIHDKSLYDLIIADIQMPELSGVELIKKIRESGITIPILAITGFSNKQLISNLVKSGCYDVLDKPFQMNEFLDRISKLLETAHTENKPTKIKKQAEMRIQLNREKGEKK
ncbi:response regulator [Candidatus Cloacimonadota bacterium]